jgi:NAD(P)-dependent dehydrogenase (short-subunit alcohol dehydrogenase family)
VTAVVVTGAASGIGRAIAERLSGDGWAVVALDRDAGGLAELARLQGCETVVGDVSDPASHLRAAELASQAAPLAGWVNSAGIDRQQRADELSLEALRAVLDVNLVGTALGCAEAVRGFLAARTAGSIVNISSLQAVAGFPSAFAYEASKGGIDALTRQLAVEYGPLGIRANAVQPGTVDTPMTKAFLEASADQAQALALEESLHPLGRIALPGEVASVVAFLLGPDASFVSGVCLPVDGGAHARCFAYPPDPRLASLAASEGAAPQG